MSIFLSTNFSLSKHLPVIGRDKDLSKILRILLKENQNSLVIVGDKGIGKSSLVELLTDKIKHKQINFDYRIVELDADEIVDALLSCTEINLKDFSKKDIYFIRNSSLLFSQSLQESRKTSKFINWLIKTTGGKVILTMNFSDYRKYIESDIILSKIFDSVKVSEVDKDSLKQIINNHLSKFSYDSSLVNEIIELGNRYLRGMMQPLKSIAIIDELKSFLNLQDKKYIESSDLKKIISEKSGIPIESLANDEREQLVILEEMINKQVIGQQSAAQKVSNVLKRARVGIKDPNRPLASFLFIGSSGVGKTEMAKVLAEIIFNSRSNLIRLDMSEYGETHNVQRLVGAPPGYIGYEEGGQLTNPVYDNPYSLLLLDELEKANSKVHDIFLQVLDEGRLTDGQGRTVDFKNTVIISTSNASYTQILDGVSDYSQLNEDSFVKTKVLPNLVKYFRPEFLNRFDEIIMFSPLDKDQLNDIAKLQIEKLAKRLLEQGIEFEVSDDTMQKIIGSSKSKIFGAREVNRLIQRYIENPIAHSIIENPNNTHIYI